MSAATPRRIIVQILLESSFYCGTLYRMPLRDRLELVKSLEKQLADGRDSKAHLQGRQRDV